MKRNPLEIFKTRDDHFAWDLYVKQVELIEQLSDAEKYRARDAVRYMRLLLGEDFLQRAVTEGNPIFLWFFRNAVPTARLELIRLTQQLKTFESVSGFKGLVSRLKNTEQAAEGLTVLDAAHKFWRASFAVSFDPKIINLGRIGSSGEKFPDLKVRDSENNQEIYVEVSRLRKGGHHELSSRTYLVIFQVVHEAILSGPEAWEDITNPRYVKPYVRILKALGDNDLMEVVNKIRELVAEVRSSKKYLEFVYKDAVEMAISPVDDHTRADAWAAERNMKDLIEAPLIHLDEISKAKGKIINELEQLPPDKPGIIVIPASENLLMFVYDPREIILNDQW